ncbi:polymer-forming cytoskeletal protein [Patescibacteria group bacterium]|nr:polymer-forming cytoskeletal protein [Patescibacteria group bacterium]
MFKISDEAYANGNGAEDTIIGSSIKVEGDLVSSGNIVVEGEVTGTIKTEKTLKVGEGAKIVANVSAREAYISGKVQGNIEVQDKIELASTGEINGDIQSKSLIILAGAVFNGKSTMADVRTIAEPEQEQGNAENDYESED